MIHRILIALNNKIYEATEASSPQYIGMGLFLLANLPITSYLDTFNLFENISLTIIRCIGILLSLLLITKNHWPKKSKTYLPTVWYFTLMYCLVFYPIFNALVNFASMVSLSAVMLSLFLLLFVVDWLSFIAISLLGIFTAGVAYYVSVEYFHHFGINSFMRGISFFINKPYVFFMFIWIMISTTIFSQSIQRTRKTAQLEKQIQMMQIVAASIAHELRTPLSTIRFALQHALKYLTSLCLPSSTSKENSEQHSQVLSSIHTANQESLSSNVLIDIILMKLHTRVDQYHVTECQIQDCIVAAINRYPFQSPIERNKVHYLTSENFTFFGIPLFTIHVLFNLIKNALHAIQKAEKGYIEIWTGKNKHYNTLHIKDTGLGLSEKETKLIFQAFYSQTNDGAGIGLSFCKAVMKGIQGDIVCVSKQHEYTEFILKFPINNSKKLRRLSHAKDN